MGPVKKLLGYLSGAGVESESERRRLARLLVSEIRLYNASALEAMKGASEPPAWFVKELSGSYRTYVRSCGEGTAAKGAFEAEAASALTEGDVSLVRQALAGSDA